MQTISIVIQRVNNACNLETVVDSRKLDEVCSYRESKKMSDEDSLGAVHKRLWQLGVGEGSKIGQNCRWIVLKTCRHGGGKLPTSFMDGP